MSSPTPIHPLQQVRDLITNAMNPNLPRDDALALVHESFQLLSQVGEGIQALQSTILEQAANVETAQATAAAASAAASAASAASVASAASATASVPTTAAAPSNVETAADAVKTYEHVLASIETLLARMAVPAPSGGPRAPIPQPLSPKFTGSDADMTLVEFQAHMATVIVRFPDALSTDRSKIFYALSSMKGTAFNYFAPYLNGRVPDVENILTELPKFNAVLEKFYGDQNDVEKSENELRRLQQTGAMAQYISAFQSLAAKVQWNEAAFLSQFKVGLSHEVRVLMSGYWTSLTTMQETQSKAMTAYQNLLAQRNLQNRHHAGRHVQAANSSVPPPPPAPAPTGMAMDLDQIHVNKLSVQERQRRMDNKLCLYCGGAGHFASKCPRKAQLASIEFNFGSGNEQA